MREQGQRGLGPLRRGDTFSVWTCHARAALRLFQCTFRRCPLFFSGVVCTCGGPSCGPNPLVALLLSHRCACSFVGNAPIAQTASEPWRTCRHRSTNCPASASPLEVAHGFQFGPSHSSHLQQRAARHRDVTDRTNTLTKTVPPDGWYLVWTSSRCPHDHVLRLNGVSLRSNRQTIREKTVS